MDCNGKRILLLGFGGEARAALVHLASRYTDIEFGVADQAADLAFTTRERELLKNYHLGPEWLAAPENYDLVVRTPGVALHHLERLRKKNPRMRTTTGTDLFLSKHAKKTIGVTGTKGKSTTSSLLYAALQLTGKRISFGGNIGIPALTLINDPADLFVLELSSYQLEDCHYSPGTAVLLNLYEEHLDHHGTIAAYGEAKARIAAMQSGEDRLILPAGNEVLERLTVSSPARRAYFDTLSGASWIEDGEYYYRAGNTVHRVCALNETRLKGPGNSQNILAVLAVLSDFEVPLPELTRVIREFSPLPHRLEEVGIIDGVCYVNDSISTVPEATINALETFKPKVKTVILGGFDRGISFSNLAEYLVTSEVETVLLFPPSGGRIAEALAQAVEGSPGTIQTVAVGSMEQAITLAQELTPPGSVCLLSPASPSFPIFKNFEHRGAAFRDEVLRRMK